MKQVKVENILKGKEDQLEPWLDQKKKIKEIADTINPYLSYVTCNNVKEAPEDFQCEAKKINDLLTDIDKSDPIFFLGDDINKTYDKFISLNIKDFKEINF